MAQFIKTYELHLGDVVRFRLRQDDNIPLVGTVQCLSEFPDVFVEVGYPTTKDYKRYRISVNMIECCYEDFDWQWDEVKFEQNEPIEFIYDENFERKIEFLK